MNLEMKNLFRKHNVKKNKDKISYPYYVDTKYGKLRLHFTDDLGGYTVFMRFDEPNKYYGNPFSGKWNIHAPTIDYAVEELDWRIRKVKK